jgi:hypothetical protein
MRDHEDKKQDLANEAWRNEEPRRRQPKRRGSFTNFTPPKKKRKKRG